ncbi:hypothetical protein [Flavobacterium aquatile]|uniref:Uncharacterized protein n=1 Tax=Flavobacterium aquatile LMG 4008 = ATCC 11947 TaxID=1453498 RepID=A0A095U3Y6_9FLAO|nr:hypothetical protein [Flavobacterium aquatile]KGD69318.1 hypothetical protein LG45_00615 [Flavobacterium aquatile LMG 4008 = ATCC 11947]OXA69569.1 hypothetical protein B0A61_00585 [Flavobacterium aquatile LMG 4008 = ATCC 11947]GEC77725.1 hypothetical protein FAQ01_05950 [Flavobacterium aquatile]
MIDPDLQNINIIPESQLTLIEIENVSKIKWQNSFLKNSIITIVIVALVISIRNHYINRKRNLNS